MSSEEFKAAVLRQGLALSNAKPSKITADRTPLSKDGTERNHGTKVQQESLAMLKRTSVKEHMVHPLINRHITFTRALFDYCSEQDKRKQLRSVDTTNAILDLAMSFYHIECIHTYERKPQSVGQSAQISTSTNKTPAEADVGVQKILSTISPSLVNFKSINISEGKEENFLSAQGNTEKRISKLRLSELTQLGQNLTPKLKKVLIEKIAPTMAADAVILKAESTREDAIQLYRQYAEENGLKESAPKDVLSFIQEKVKTLGISVDITGIDMKQYLCLRKHQSLQSASNLRSTIEAFSDIRKGLERIKLAKEDISSLAESLGCSVRAVEEECSRYKWSSIRAIGRIHPKIMVLTIILMTEDTREELLKLVETEFSHSCYDGVTRLLNTSTPKVS